MVIGQTAEWIKIKMIFAFIKNGINHTSKIISSYPDIEG